MNDTLMKSSVDVPEHRRMSVRYHVLGKRAGYYQFSLYLGDRVCVDLRHGFRQEGITSFVFPNDARN